MQKQKSKEEKPKGGERALEKPSWLTSSGPALDSLDDMAKDKSSFDQFAGRNKSSYKDSLYTSEIQHDKITSEMHTQAARLEDEIQNTTSNNRHILEERGLLNREERDETGLY